MTKTRKFWEGLIAVIIIFAVIQIFTEDLGRLLGWAYKAREILIILGFAFDVIFTIEFTVRSIISGKSKGWVHYFVYEKGWVDFMSSLPLLLFNSGPLLIGMFFPGRLAALPFMGEFNVLKATKILRLARLARMLRMLRLLKLFHTSEPDQAGEALAERRHLQLTKGATISMTTVILVLILCPLFPRIFYTMDGLTAIKDKRYTSELKDWYVAMKGMDAPRAEFINKVLAEDHDILYLYHGGRTVINNLGEGKGPETDIHGKWFYTDYKVKNLFGFKLYYSIRDIEETDARIYLMINTIIIFVMLAFILFYREPTAEKP